MCSKMHLKTKVEGKAVEKLDKLTYTYAPTTMEKSFKTILQTAVNEGWSIRGVDFTNAFLQADLKKPNYVQLPNQFNNDDGIPVIWELYGNYNEPYTVSKGADVLNRESGESLKQDGVVKMRTKSSGIRETLSRSLQRYCDN